MEETTQVQEQAEAKKRPGFLTVLCILTFIGSGLSLLSYLLLVIAAGALGSVMESIPGWSEIANMGILYLILFAVLSAASLFGAIMMWQMKKLGFYIYAAAQVIAMVLGFTVMGLIFTALFIVLYFLNFKHME